MPEIVLSSLMGLWNFFKCFLSSPLYICIIINSMVLLIAASSRFHRHVPDDDHHAVDFDEISKRTISTVSIEVAKLPSAQATTNPVTKPLSHQSHEEKGLDHSKETFLSEVLEISTANSLDSWPPLTVSTGKRMMATTPKNDKKNCVDEKKLQELSKENEEDDTLEATWKAITGGGKEKTKMKLKKSETWDVPPRKATVQRFDSEEVLPSTPAWKELRKSETFNDAVSIIRRGGLRRDPSMSLDELNHKVEAFIKKFNDNIRLQRQESDQRFLDMINNRRS